MVQLYLLLDCVDGEIARWKKQYSLNGVYLDRVGAYLTDAAVLVGFGLRAADLWGSGRIDWLWAFLGTLAALGAILIKAETDLVGVARHQGGLPPVKEAASEPRSSGMQLARKAAAALKFHRLVLGSRRPADPRPGDRRPGARRPVLHPARCRRARRHRPAPDPAAPRVHPAPPAGCDERPPEGRR
ncbi:hypothetical protein SALBM311S_08791 [Streptomyces alboniger]